MAEIEAAIIEEQEARRDLGLKNAFLGKGNLIRFIIAFVIFFFQQWAGQNSVKWVIFRIPKSISLFFSIMLIVIMLLKYLLPWVVPVYR